MYTLSELFASNGPHWAAFLDTVSQVEGSLELPERDWTVTQLRTLFLTLPEHIQDPAFQWGCQDAEFWEPAIDFLEENPQNLR